MEITAALPHSINFERLDVVQETLGLIFLLLLLLQSCGCTLSLQLLLLLLAQLTLLGLLLQLSHLSLVLELLLSFFISFNVLSDVLVDLSAPLEIGIDHLSTSGASVEHRCFLLFIKLFELIEQTLLTSRSVLKTHLFIEFFEFGLSLLLLGFAKKVPLSKQPCLPLLDCLTTLYDTELFLLLCVVTLSFLSLLTHDFEHTPAVFLLGLFLFRI